MNENLDKVIEFKEELLIEDLQVANYYNFKKQRKHIVNQIIFIAMSVIMIAMSISEKAWLLLAIGVALLLFSVFLFVPLYKKMIYSAVKKNMSDSLKIKLLFDNEGFIYALDEETESQKYQYNQVTKVIDLPEYIYLYFSSTMIAIVKKNMCAEILDLEELIKDKYTALNKYYKEEKMPK